MQEWRSDWLSRHERLPWLVATDDDRVVGLAYASPWNRRDAYHWTVETTVYVAVGHQRRGLGDALYTDLLDRLRGQGFHSALAIIALPNDPSVRLHERHGFTEVGRLREAGFKLGHWRDVAFWQCRLSEGSEPPRPTSPVRG